jgi:hypothetical protein
MTPPSNENNHRVTNKQIVDAINTLTIRVEVMASKLDSEILKTDKVINDHEDRIRSLEKLVWTSSWVSSGVSTVITALAVAFITGKL